MIFFERKAFKIFFTIICTIVVAFMVGFWCYKYEVEDRDIGVVDYTLLQDAEEIEFPAVSFCLKDPFLDEKLKAINSNITRETYLKYLEGEHYDDTHARIDYANVTIDLSKYFEIGEIMWQSPTQQFDGTINHTEIFNGFHYSHFVKCFTINYNGADQRKIKSLTVSYDKRRLQTDWKLNLRNLAHLGTIYISAHYPGQFFLENEFRTMYLLQHAVVRFKGLEILKRRNSRRRKCMEVKNEYDKKIIDELLFKKRCRVPYLNEKKSYPRCNSQEKIKDSLIDTLIRKTLQMPKACERISKMRVDFESWVPQPYNQQLIVSIDFPEEVKIITQSKDVDIHALIGNIGGYLGLFLGNKFDSLNHSNDIRNLSYSF